MYEMFSQPWAPDIVYIVHNVIYNLVPKPQCTLKTIFLYNLGPKTHRILYKTFSLTQPPRQCIHCNQCFLRRSPPDTVYIVHNVLYKLAFQTQCTLYTILYITRPHAKCALWPVPSEISQNEQKQFFRGGFGVKKHISN